MLRSVLLVVDTTDASREAAARALALARAHNLTLGLTSMLDLFWACRAGWRSPLLGLEVALRPERVEALYDDQHRAIDNVEQDAAAAGVRSERVRAPDYPGPAFAVFSHAYDLVVLGNDATFHLEVEPHLRSPVERICRELVRPVLVHPATPSPGGGVLIGYDGSAAASRTMLLAVLLGFAEETPVNVLSIADDPAEALAMAGTGTALLSHHGIAATPHGLARDGDEGTMFLRRLADDPPARAVLGATGHSAWAETVLGSTTRALLHEASVPLFIGS